MGSAKQPPNNSGKQYVGIIDEEGNVRKIKPLTPLEALSIEATIDQLSDAESSSDGEKKPKRVPKMMALTSGHRTSLPGLDEFLMLTGSFGPGITKQASLWPEESGFDLTLPNGRLRVEGQTGPENTSLQHYVARELGPEGLKHLTALIEVYDLITQGDDQKLDCEITAKQLLQRLGREDHADDKDEQDNVVNTALYLARTFVTVISSREQRSSPLLILESIRTDASGTFLRYHLGKEFYTALYGRQKQTYMIPTGQLIGYHSIKAQHELLLIFHLGAHLARGQGTYATSFIDLCVDSGLYTLERLLPGEKNRMRDAQQVLLAFERMEHDGLIHRQPHEDIDLIHAVTLCLNLSYEKQLAPATLERIRPIATQIKGYQTKELNAKRRAALQRLLHTERDREENISGTPGFSSKIVFKAGDLLTSIVPEYQVKNAP